MKNIYVVDTNFIYSFFVLRDSCNDKALRAFDELPYDSTFIVPKIVVAELIISAEDVNFIMRSKVFNGKFTGNNEADLEFINNLDRKLKQPLKAIDCLILALCKRYNAKLLTFDRKLEKAYKQIC